MPSGGGGAPAEAAKACNLAAIAAAACFRFSSSFKSILGGRLGGTNGICGSKWPSAEGGEAARKPNPGISVLKGSGREAGGALAERCCAGAVKEGGTAEEVKEGVVERGVKVG